MKTTIIKRIGGDKLGKALILIEDWYAFLPNKFYDRNTLYKEIKEELKLHPDAFAIVSDYIQANPVSKYGSWREHSNAFTQVWLSKQPKITLKENLREKLFSFLKRAV